MKSRPNSTLKFSAVIPISRNSELDNLKLWIPRTDLSSVELILVFDGLDEVEIGGFRRFMSEQDVGLVKELKVDFGNPGSTRNSGLSQISCDWVCFWDADDVPKVEHFYEMVKFAERHLLDAVIGGFTCENEDDGTALTTNSKSHTFKEISRDIIRLPGIWRFLFSCNSIAGKLFPPVGMGEDQYFLMSMKLHDLKIGAYPYPVYAYKRGMTGHLTTHESAVPEMRKCLDVMSSYFDRDKANLSKLNRRLFLKMLLVYLIRTRFIELPFVYGKFQHFRILLKIPLDIAYLLSIQIFGKK